METLNTFTDGEILTAEQLNAIVDVVNEIVETDEELIDDILS